MSRVAVVLIFSIVFMSSCGKLKFTETEINGSAISLTDNSPLKGYSIHLVETYVPSKPFSPISIETIATTVTDENGEFYFQNELRKNSKYSYTIEFDNHGEMFFPEAWQTDNYPPVDGVIEVDKGQINNIEIGEIPTGAIKMIATNYSNYSIFLEANVRNSFYDWRHYYHSVESGKSFSYDVYGEVPSGYLEIEWLVIIENDTQVVVEEIIVEHNRNMDVEFFWP